MRAHATKHAKLYRAANCNPTPVALALLLSSQHYLAFRAFILAPRERLGTHQGRAPVPLASFLLVPAWALQGALDALSLINTQRITRCYVAALSSTRTTLAGTPHRCRACQ